MLQGFSHQGRSGSALGQTAAIADQAEVNDHADGHHQHPLKDDTPPKAQDVAQQKPRVVVGSSSRPAMGSTGAEPPWPRTVAVQSCC